MSKTPVIYMPEKDSEALSLTEQAMEWMIIDKKTFDFAGELSISLARVKKQIKKNWEKPVADAKTSYDTIKACRDSEIEPVEKAENYIGKERALWRAEQDRLERIEQAKLEKEAHEKAEKERQKLLDKALQAQTPEKQEALLAKAEQVFEQPVFAEKAVQKTTKLEGGGSITFVDDIKVTVLNIKEACQSVADGIIPELCVEFKSLKTPAKMFNWKGKCYGLNIENIQREMKRI